MKKNDKHKYILIKTLIVTKFIYDAMVHIFCNKMHLFLPAVDSMWMINGKKN